MSALMWVRKWARQKDLTMALVSALLSLALTWVCKWARKMDLQMAPMSALLL
jgi:hypothetical protein